MEQSLVDVSEFDLWSSILACSQCFSPRWSILLLIFTDKAFWRELEQSKLLALLYYVMSQRWQMALSLCLKHRQVLRSDIKTIFHIGFQHVFRRLSHDVEMNASDIFANLLDCFIELALTSTGDKNISTFLDEPLCRGCFRRWSPRFFCQVVLE